MKQVSDLTTKQNRSLYQGSGEVKNTERRYVISWRPGNHESSWIFPCLRIPFIFQ